MSRHDRTTIRPTRARRKELGASRNRARARALTFKTSKRGDRDVERSAVRAVDYRAGLR